MTENLLLFYRSSVNITVGYVVYLNSDKQYFRVINKSELNKCIIIKEISSLNTFAIPGDISIL